MLTAQEMLSILSVLPLLGAFVDSMIGDSKSPHTTDLTLYNTSDQKSFGRYIVEEIGFPAHHLTEMDIVELVRDITFFHEQFTNILW